MPQVINRIFCGDALRLLPRIPDRSVDLIVTDPPYGDNIGYGIHNRTIAGNEHPLVGLMVIAASYRVLKSNAAVYMFFGFKHLPIIRTFLAHYTKYRIRDVLIWDKMLRGRGHGFRRQYECVLVLEKGKPRYRQPGLSNVLKFQRTRATAHPHTKSLTLIETLIRQSSDERGVVLDPFLGSGTTAVAAVRTGRRYIGFEVEPRYCAIAENRLTQESGEMREAV